MKSEGLGGHFQEVMPEWTSGAHYTLSLVTWTQAVD